MLVKTLLLLAQCRGTGAFTDFGVEALHFSLNHTTYHGAWWEAISTGAHTGSNRPPTLPTASTHPPRVHPPFPRVRPPA